jgi:hypothetical protein
VGIRVFSALAILSENESSSTAMESHE